MLLYELTIFSDKKKMNEVKRLGLDMNAQRFGLMYNSFVQTVGSIQCGSTFLATIGVLACAISLAMNNLVLYRTITS